MLDSLFNKVVGSKACNFIKKTLQHRCFPVKIAKFLETGFFYITPLMAAFTLPKFHVACSFLNDF